jgi:hypothetical protein
VKTHFARAVPLSEDLKGSVIKIQTKDLVDKHLWFFSKKNILIPNVAEKYSDFGGRKKK